MSILIPSFSKRFAFFTLILLLLSSSLIVFSIVNNENDSNLIHWILFFSMLVAISCVCYFLHLVWKMSQTVESLMEQKKSDHQSLVESLKLATIGEMSAGIAHELNNPLSVIIGRAEILLAQMEEGQRDDAFTLKSVLKINEMAFRISTIVTSMRKIARTTHQRDLGPQTISAVIQDVLNLCTEKLRKSLITFDFESVDKNLMVKSDYSYLSQILIHLINAIVEQLKKSPEEERAIVMSIFKKEREIDLIIKFSGVMTHQESLGLSIARDLMLSMGASLKLQTFSLESSFTLTFSKA